MLSVNNMVSRCALIVRGAVRETVKRLFDWLMCGLLNQDVSHVLSTG